MQKLYFLLFLIISSTVYADWQDVKFNYKILDERVKLNKDKKTATILDELIKMDNQNIENLIDKNNNSIRLVQISYQAPFKNQDDIEVKMTQIDQQGLFASFTGKLKNALLKNNLNLRMQYDTVNPVAVRFILDEEIIAAPALVTDKIDNKWQIENKTL